MVVIDLDALATRTIASFPPAQAGEPDIAVSSFLTDIAVLPDGRILISSCCEPAAGYIRVLSERGANRGSRSTGTIPKSTHQAGISAMTFLQSLAIVPASLRRGGERYIDGRGRFSPLDPGGSPDGDQVIFSWSGDSASSR